MPITVLSWAFCRFWNHSVWQDAVLPWTADDWDGFANEMWMEPSS